MALPQQPSEAQQKAETKNVPLTVQETQRSLLSRLGSLLGLGGEKTHKIGKKEQQMINGLKERREELENYKTATEREEIIDALQQQIETINDKIQRLETGQLPATPTEEKVCENDNTMLKFEFDEANHSCTVTSKRILDTTTELQPIEALNFTQMYSFSDAKDYRDAMEWITDIKQTDEYLMKVFDAKEADRFGDIRSFLKERFLTKRPL